MYKYELFVGLYDLITNKEIMSNNEFMKKIEIMFMKENKSFSVFKNIGGYLYNSNTYVIEHGNVLTLINYSEDEVRNYANQIKKMLNQESILILRKEITVNYE